MIGLVTFAVGGKIQTAERALEARQMRGLAIVTDRYNVVDFDVAIALSTREMIRRHTVHATNGRVVQTKASERRTRFESLRI